MVSSIGSGASASGPTQIVPGGAAPNLVGELETNQGIKTAIMSQVPPLTKDQISLLRSSLDEMGNGINNYNNTGSLTGRDNASSAYQTIRENFRIQNPDVYAAVRNAILQNVDPELITLTLGKTFFTSP